MVTAIVIIEMMGRPPEHLKKALEAHIQKFEGTKGITVNRKVFSEPRLLDEKNELYTAFSEVEFSVATLKDVLDIIFEFMPASIEIVDPPTLSIPSDELTAVVNNLTGRLHRYDDVAKIMKNRENKMIQDIQVMKKLLYEHKIIDKEGKLIKVPKGSKIFKERPKKKSAKKTTKKKAVKKAKKKKK